MQIIVWVLSFVAYLFFALILGFQFFKIGRRLKEKYIIIYRIYIIFWILISAIIVVGLLIQAQNLINLHNTQKRQQQLTSILSLNDVTVVRGESMTNRERVERAVIDGRKVGITHDDIYIHAKKSKIFSRQIKAARDAGYSDDEIKLALFYR